MAFAVVVASPWAVISSPPWAAYVVLLVLYYAFAHQLIVEGAIVGPEDVDVVILNYKTASLAAEAAESAHANGAESIFVIDNGSKDGSVPYLQRRIGNFCEVEPMQSNIGFAGAMNRGARRGNNPIILFANADVRLQEDAIQAMVEAFAKDPRTGAVGPGLFYPDGRPQASAYLFITPARVTMQMFGIDKIANRLNCHLLAGSEDPTKNGDYTGEVESLYGACFCVRRSAFEAVPGFDEEFFLYCEETDLFFRLTERGWKIMRDAGARVTHNHRESAKRADFNTLVSMQESRWYYACKHFGALGRRIVAVASIVGLFLRLLFLSGNSDAAERYADALKWWFGDRQ